MSESAEIFFLLIEIGKFSSRLIGIEMKLNKNWQILYFSKLMYNIIFEGIFKGIIRFQFNVEGNYDASN